MDGRNSEVYFDKAGCMIYSSSLTEMYMKTEDYRSVWPFDYICLNLGFEDPWEPAFSPSRLEYTRFHQRGDERPNLVLHATEDGLERLNKRAHLKQ